MAFTAELDSAEGVVISLTLQGVEMRTQWNVTTPQDAVAALRKEAEARGVPLAVTFVRDPWITGARTLLLGEHDDTGWFTPSGVVDEPTSPASSPSSDAVAPELMSRAVREAWVMDEVLNPVKATVGTSTIRTRAGVDSTPRRRLVHPIAAVIAVAVLVSTVAAGVALTTDAPRSHQGHPVVRSDSTPAPTSATQSADRDPFAISPAALTATDRTVAGVRGYVRAWSVKSDTAIATRRAVVLVENRQFTALSPVDGRRLGSIAAYGKVETVVTGRVATPGGKSVTVLVWQGSGVLHVRPVSGSHRQTVTVKVPAGATVSARLDGVLVTDRARPGRVGLLTGGNGKRFTASLRWLSAPASAGSSGAQTGTGGRLRQWAYASTEEGRVMWLTSDATARMPDGAHVSAARPRAGLAFAGWVGASVHANGTAGVLIGAWQDPVDGTVVLSTYRAAEGQSAPVAAVEADPADLDAGVFGVSEAAVGVGSWIIDSTSGQIVASGVRDGLRIAGVGGGVAECVDAQGRSRLVSLAELHPLDTSMTASTVGGEPAQVVAPLLTVDLVGFAADGTLITESGGRVSGMRTR